MRLHIYSIIALFAASLNAHGEVDEYTNIDIRCEKLYNQAFNVPELIKCFEISKDTSFLLELENTENEIKIAEKIFNDISNANYSNIDDSPENKHQKIVDDLVKLSTSNEFKANSIVTVSRWMSNIDEEKLKIKSIEFGTHNEIGNNIINKLQNNLDLRNAKTRQIKKGMETIYRHRKYIQDISTPNQKFEFYFSKINNSLKTMRFMAGKINSTFENNESSYNKNDATIVDLRKLFVDLYLENKNILGDPEASKDSQFNPQSKYFNEGVGAALNDLTELIADKCETGTACNMLAKSFEGDVSRTEDRERVLYLYETACARNHGSSCHRAGLIYLDSEHVSKAPTRALQFFKYACDLGHGPGCNNLHTLACEDGVTLSCQKLEDLASTNSFLEVFTVGNDRLLKGEISKAAEKYSEAIDIANVLIVEDPTNDEWAARHSAALRKKGNVRQVQWDFSSARSLHVASLKLAKERACIAKDSIRCKLLISKADRSLGETYLAKREASPGNYLDEATHHIVGAVRLSKELVESDPTDLELQLNLADALLSAGELALSEDLAAKAVQEFLFHAHDITLHLSEFLPESSAVQFAHAEVLSKLGDAFEVEARRTQNVRHLNSLVENYAKGVSIASKYAKLEPENTDWQFYLARAGIKLSAAHLGLGNLTLANEDLEESIDILEHLVTVGESNGVWKYTLAGAYTDRANLGEASISLGQIVEKDAVVKDYRKAIEINKELLTLDPERADIKRISSILLARIDNLER